jgi:hypothetical protein
LRFFYFPVVEFPDYPACSSELSPRNRLSSSVLMASRLLSIGQEEVEMDAIMIVGAVVGSFAGAFILQKAALEGMFRMMNADRRLRH